MRYLRFVLPLVAATTFAACGQGDEDQIAAADVGPDVEGKADALGKYGDALVGAYDDGNYAVPHFHGLVLYADGHYIADSYLYHVDCIPGPCQDQRTTGKWSAGKTYLKLSGKYYEYTATQKNGKVASLELRKSNSQDAQTMKGVDTWCVQPTDCGGQPMPLLGCMNMHFTCAKNACGQSCAPPPDACKSNADCGAGEWCSACWGHMACIPKGAMC